MNQQRSKSKLALKKLTLHGYWAPFMAVFGTIGIFLLAQIIGVNLVALLRLAQGFPIKSIESWLDSSLSGQFTLHLVVAAVGIWLAYGALRLFGASWGSIGLKKPKLVYLLHALAGYGWYLLIYFVALGLVGWLLPSVNLDQSQQLGFSTTTTGSSLILIFISLVIFPPFYEEILARGLLLTGLRKKFPLPLAAVVTSVLFAAAHLQWGTGAPLLWVAAIDTFILSMVLVYLKEKTGSLWPPIGLHALKNAAAFTLLFVLKKG